MSFAGKSENTLAKDTKNAFSLQAMNFDVTKTKKRKKKRLSTDLKNSLRMIKLQNEQCSATNT